MKKLIVYNDHLQKLFCRYEITECGFLYVHFYLPENGFSVIWLKDKYVRINGVQTLKDGRDRKYSRVDYLIHPSYWLGENFDSPVWDSPTKVIERVSDNIHILS